MRWDDAKNLKARIGPFGRPGRIEIVAAHEQNQCREGTAQDYDRMTIIQGTPP